MLYLILAIIFSSLIANALKFYSKDKDLPTVLVFFGNYFFGAVIAFFSVKSFSFNYSGIDYTLGFITGLSFLINFLVYQKCLNLNGISFSVSIMRISLIIPLIFAIFLFNESLIVWNYLGILVVLAGIYLMKTIENKPDYLWIFLLFLATGCTDALLKFFNVYGKCRNSEFIFLVFGSAALFNLILLIRSKIRFNWKYFFFGLVLGIPNQFTTFYFIKALDNLSAAIVYPMFASGVVLVSILSDVILWKTRLSLKQSMCLTLLLAGIIFLNLK